MTDPYGSPSEKVRLIHGEHIMMENAVWVWEGVNVAVNIMITTFYIQVIRKQQQLQVKLKV